MSKDVWASFKADFSCSGVIQGQFQLVSAAGQYDPIRPIPPDFGRIGPVQRESARIGAKSEQIPKKKKLRRGTDTQAAASDAGAAPILPRPCIIGFLNTPQTLEKHETKSLSSITFAIKMFSPKYFCPKEMEP